MPVPGQTLLRQLGEESPEAGALRNGKQAPHREQTFTCTFDSIHGLFLETILYDHGFTWNIGTFFELLDIDDDNGTEGHADDEDRDGRGYTEA